MLVLDVDRRTGIICPILALLFGFLPLFTIPGGLLAGDRFEQSQAESVAFDVESDAAGAITADLQERLEKDLKARRPVEFAFIAEVVELVEEDELPLSLVNRCYLWARRQSTYPFQHFQRALQIEARKIGVDI